jgi:hypothetical protein
MFGVQNRDKCVGRGLIGIRRVLKCPPSKTGVCGKGSLRPLSEAVSLPGYSRLSHKRPGVGGTSSAHFAHSRLWNSSVDLEILFAKPLRLMQYR